VVAFADLENDGNITQDGATYTLSLSLYAGTSDSPWTGTGTYNVYVMFNGGGRHYYKASNVTFSAAATTVAFGAATEIYPSDDDDETDGILTAPSGVQAEALSSSEIRLSWPSVSGAVFYNVYRSTYSSEGYYFVDRVYFSWDTTDYDYTDTGLESNTPYYYKVRAYNIAGGGPQSNYMTERTF
jgi:hypothetical protein